MKFRPFFVLIFLLPSIVWPAVYFIRRLPRKASEAARLAGSARLLAGLIGVLNLVFTIGVALTLQIKAYEFVYCVPPFFIALLCIPLATTILTVALVPHSAGIEKCVWVGHKTIVLLIYYPGRAGFHRVPELLELTGVPILNGEKILGDMKRLGMEQVLSCPYNGQTSANRKSRCIRRETQTHRIARDDRLVIFNGPSLWG